MICQHICVNSRKRIESVRIQQASHIPVCLQGTRPINGWKIAPVRWIVASTSIFLFLEIFASLRQRQRRAPAFLNSSPGRPVRERHRGSDIFWRLVPRSPISEVFSSKLQLVWPLLILIVAVVIDLGGLSGGEYHRRTRWER